MKNITAKFDLSIGYVGATHEDTMDFEFEDDVTQEEIDKEIEAAWQEWIWNYIDGGWSVDEG